MGGRTIIVGDVHGCRQELEALLDACALSSSDTLALVGDLVAKGPDSVGVLRLVRQAGGLAVLGNHDAHVLRPKHKPTPEHQRVIDALSEEDWAFLASLPLYRHFPDRSLIVVHGGLIPGVPLEEQEPEWLLNLRSLTPEGRPSKRVEAGSPWAASWKGPQRVAFGHDAVRGLQRHPFATGLDTGCVYGGALTALILPENRLVSVPARRVYHART